MWTRSSFAWPIFLDNLGLGSGWPRLGSGGPPEGPDVDDDITSKLAKLLRNSMESCFQGFCLAKTLPGVLSDVAFNRDRYILGLFDSLLDRECKIG